MKNHRCSYGHIIIDLFLHLLVALIALFPAYFLFLFHLLQSNRIAAKQMFPEIRETNFSKSAKPTSAKS